MRKRLPAAMRAFQEERLRLGLAVTTRYFGAQVLRELERAVSRRLRDPYLSDLSREDLFAVVDGMKARGLSVSTVFAAASVLKTFCRYWHKKGLLLLDPSESLVVPPPRRSLGHIPSVAEVERLLYVARPEAVLLREGLATLPEDASPHERARFERRRELWNAACRRDLAMLELLYGSGLRISEVVRLDVPDLDLSERTAFVRAGKGQKDRVVPLTRAFVDAVCDYIQKGRPHLLSFAPRGTQAVFLTEKGRRIDTWFWGKTSLKPLLREAQLSLKLTPHRLRHACAVHLLEAGAELPHISRLLGHATLGSTTIYLGLDTARLDRMLRKAHPRERQEP